MQIKFSLLLLKSLFFFFISTTSCNGQRNLGYTSANECRHTAILSKLPQDKIYTTRCYIKSQTIELEQYIRDTRATVDQEWQWILDHNGSISGQVIVEDGNSVYMISQKECLDRGNSAGRQMRVLQENLKESSTCDDEKIQANISLVSHDFEYLNDGGDTYSDCVDNDRPWTKFSQVEQHGNSISFTDLSPGVKQYLAIHGGGHHSGRITLQENNFTYDSRAIESKFIERVTTISEDDCTSRKKQKSHYNNQDFDHPVVLGEYPFETGMSILARATEVNAGSPLRACLFTKNPAFIAWNRVLQARYALSGKNSTETLQYPHFDVLEGVLIVAGAIITIVFAMNALRVSSSAGPTTTNTAKLAENSYDIYVDDAVTRQLTTLYSEIDARELRNYSNESFTMLYEIGGAITSFVIVFRTVLQSNYWPRRLIEVSQGGVITYGPQYKRLSLKENSSTAGTQFFVSHWYRAHVSKQGFEWTRIVLYSIIGLICIALYVSAVLLSYKRQTLLYIWPVPYPFG